MGKVALLIALGAILGRMMKCAKKLQAGRLLAPGGRVVVIDSPPNPGKTGRGVLHPNKRRQSREELDGHFAEAGLKPIKVHDFLTRQYFVEYGVK